MVCDNVTVVATDDSQTGVVAQNGDVAEGWDMGVTRTEALKERDFNAAGTLKSVEVVGPCERPVSSEVARNGLGFLIDGQ